MPVMPEALGDSAWEQARHVFLGGNGLPDRWHGRRRFVILETGFGLGHNFLASWLTWLRDARRCDHLVFISIEPHPPTREDLSREHGLTSEPQMGVGMGDGGAAEPDQAAFGEQADQAWQRQLARRLIKAWPSLTPGMHALDFDDAGAVPSEAARMNKSRVTLLLGLGEIAALLPMLVAQVDAFYLDRFAPGKPPRMWDEWLLSRLHRFAAPCATAASWSTATCVCDGLTKAGFRVAHVPGFAGQRDMVQARYEPRYTAPKPAGGCWPEPEDVADLHAIVLGAGLAGCSAALSLCRAGWRVTLLDRHDGPAQDASGNPGGLFHSVVHGEDGVHARAHRAAALATWRQAVAWIDAGRLKGDARGLLRLDERPDGDDAKALLARLGLPPDHVQWLDAEEARACAGMAVPSGGWLFHQAGWLHPAGLAKAMLDEASSLMRDGRPLLSCLWGHEVTSLSTSEDGLWQVCDIEGVITQAPSLVLCNALAAPGLLASLPSDRGVAPFPLDSVRGQITQWQLSAASESGAVHMPRLPVAGSGYVLPLTARVLLCGATTQQDDVDPKVREADHRHNLAQAARLGACDALPAHAPLPPGLTGRTAWRAMTPDRLPIIGALPLSAERLSCDAGRRRDQVRLIARERGARGGLYVLVGLGSRGITWSCLAGELLAHWVTGAPCPVEADLRDAMDPARFLVRQMTKGISDQARMHTQADKY